MTATPTPRRRRRYALLGALAAVATLTTGAGSLSAAPAPTLQLPGLPGAPVPPPGTNGPAPPSHPVSPAEDARSHQVPLDTIVRDAQPLPIPIAMGTPSPQQGPDGPPLSVPGAAATGAGTLSTTAAQNGYWPGAYSVNPNRQVGRLYFDVKAGPGETWNRCSATAVNSENKAVVVTAGHCVYNPDPDGNGRVEGNGYWYEHVQFCPGYENGCRLGVWYSRINYSTSSWVYGTGTPRTYNWSDDMAVVLVSPNSRGAVVNAVGGQGITFNAGTGLYRTALGYPVTDARWPAYTYSGEDLVYCQGYDVWDGAGHLRLACTMTGGASGGPWIINPNASWLGYVNSVNSHKPWGGPYMGGPYFNNPERDLFQYTRNR